LFKCANFVLKNQEEFALTDFEPIKHAP
jgi:hypothetical protein